jgi:hypothetical protein
MHNYNNVAQLRHFRGALQGIAHQCKALDFAEILLRKWGAMRTWQARAA